MNDPDVINAEKKPNRRRCASSSELGDSMGLPVERREDSRRRMRQRDESVVHTFVMESSAGVCDENEKRTAVHTNLVVGSLDENDATSRTDTTGLL